jgi:hypothetical protein
VETRRGGEGRGRVDRRWHFTHPNHLITKEKDNLLGEDEQYEMPSREHEYEAWSILTPIVRSRGV